MEGEERVWAQVWRLGCCCAGVFQGPDGRLLPREIGGVFLPWFGVMDAASLEGRGLFLDGCGEGLFGRDASLWMAEMGFLRKACIYIKLSRLAVSGAVWFSWHSPRFGIGHFLERG